jgi:hypothetical protein
MVLAMIFIRLPTTETELRSGTVNTKLMANSGQMVM